MEILLTLYQILNAIVIWRHIWEFVITHAYSRITLNWHLLDGATLYSKQLSVLWQCLLVLRKGFQPVKVPLQQEEQHARCLLLPQTVRNPWENKYKQETVYTTDALLVWFHWRGLEISSWTPSMTDGLISAWCPTSSHRFTTSKYLW